MRRLFVIFLALLFPLNVYALSMSASSLPHGAAAGHAVAIHAAVLQVDDGQVDDRQADNIHVGDTGFDIDPDEPPAGMDFHDTVNAAPRLLPAIRPANATCSALPDRHGRDPLPPIKPPPAA